MTALLADMGGTNTRCALSGAQGPRRLREYRNRDFAGPAELLGAYVDGLTAADRPARAFMAVAGPIRGDAVNLVNIDWKFSADGLRSALGLQQLRLMNDFEALAYSLPRLGDGQLLAIGDGTEKPRSAKAVIGPGTGLGVGALVPVGGDWQAVPGEGGHVTLPASDEREAGIIREARRRKGHCSAERLVSGPGLALLHSILHGDDPLDPADIGELIEAGDPAALDSFEAMCRFLGTVAADLALTVGAYGGVYIGGGILPRYPELFADSGFRARFEDKGRYRDYLTRIPVRLITADNPTLIGLDDRAGAPVA